MLIFAVLATHYKKASAYSIPKTMAGGKVIKAIEFSYSGITSVSERQFSEHYKLYKGYVDKVNEITRKLGNGENGSGEANSTYSLYRGLKESEGFALNGAILHELYFENLGGSAGKPGPKTEKLISVQFGSYEKFCEDLTACCKAARGWCVFTYEHRTASFRNILLDAHNVGNVILSYPLLAVDMYEHAYFYDYQTDKAKYISAVISNINWDVVDKRTGYLFSRAGR